MHGARKILSSVGGTRLALGAIALTLAFVLILLTWPPFAPLFSSALPGGYGALSLVASVVLALAISQVIVSRRRTATALRTSEAQLRSSWEHATTGSMLLDLQGHVSRINPAAVRWFGDPEQAQHYCALTQPAQEQEERARFLELAQGRRDEYQREQAFRTKSGSVIWARGVMSLIRDDQGQPAGALLMLEDITDRKTLEEQLRQTQKLDGMGRLVATVAHDFNNLLTALGGYAELARANVDDPVPQRHLDEVLAVTRRATTLTRQLLVFSRRPAADPPPLQFDEAVESMASLVRGLMGRGVVVVTTLGGLGASVKLDPSHLGQILVNLAVNARDAMPDGGTLTIETSLLQEPGPNTPTRSVQMAPGRYVLLTVSDTGVGMDDEVRARLFEPFFTTKSAGTGLGLDTVCVIVEQSGGHIWVESAPGRGSRFAICFPQVPAVLASTLAPPPALAPEPEPRGMAPGAGSSRNATILVVEGDSSVRGFTCAVLRNAGYEALDAATSNEALALASASGHPLSLIMTNATQPGGGGSELIRQLRRMVPNAGVLYASGCSALTLKSEGVIDDTSGFLPKPFTRHELLAAVQARLDGGQLGVLH